jgi:hypothetical protein
MSTPKWTEERTEALINFVGDESPVSQETVASAAEELETSTRSVASKLRKMEYEVERAGTAPSKFSEAQEATLRAFVEDNSGEYTYAEIAEAFEDGNFTPKQIQGKVLSMQLTEHVKAAPKPESTKTFTDAQEQEFVSLVEAGKYMEEIAEALDVTINRARGKALSLLRSGAIESIPSQRDRKTANKEDPLESLGDLSGMTVVEISESIGKSVRGVKTMLTRRGLTASDYDGAARKEKNATA